jgi:hypothetical protein
MLVRLKDEDYAADFLGFRRRAHCGIADKGEGLYDVFLAREQPRSVALAELRAYLAIWERANPGGRAILLDDADADGKPRP